MQFPKSLCNANRRKSSRRVSLRLAWVGALILLLAVAGSAAAAEFAGGDIYILPRGEVVSDDLYVSGEEVTIDGTVEGDLIAAGGYIEVNGVVNGDLIAAGGTVVLIGVVQDDVRIAGGGVVIRGTVGDDLVVAAGGGWPAQAFVPMMVRGREMAQGLTVAPAATIGGDAILGGGAGNVGGTIGRNLYTAFGTLDFSGRANGDARLFAQTLTVAGTARVQGELRYSAQNEDPIPAGVANTVVATPWQAREAAVVERNLLGDAFRWLWRTALVLGGTLLIGWLVWSLARRQLREPVAIVDARPAEAGIVGILVAVAVIPVTVALVFVAAIIWGFFPGGLVVLTLSFGLFGLLWLISPAIAGLWVGRKIAAATGAFDTELAQLLVGIVAIVVVARLLMLIPCVGELAYRVIYLASFAFAVGGWLLARRQAQDAPLPPYAAAAI